MSPRGHCTLHRTSVAQTVLLAGESRGACCVWVGVCNVTVACWQSHLLSMCLLERVIMPCSLVHASCTWRCFVHGGHPWHMAWSRSCHVCAVGVCWEFWCFCLVLDQQQPMIGQGQERGGLWSSYMQLAFLFAHSLWRLTCPWCCGAATASNTPVGYCPVTLYELFRHSTHHPYMCHYYCAECVGEYSGLQQHLQTFTCEVPPVAMWPLGVAATAAGGACHEHPVAAQPLRPLGGCFLSKVSSPEALVLFVDDARTCCAVVSMHTGYTFDGQLQACFLVSEVLGSCPGKGSSCVESTVLHWRLFAWPQGLLCQYHCQYACCTMDELSVVLTSCLHGLCADLVATAVWLH